MIRAMCDHQDWPGKIIVKRGQEREPCGPRHPEAMTRSPSRQHGMELPILRQLAYSL